MGANRKESKQVNFRVSDDEYKRLELMAQQQGMTVPSFCKKRAQGAKLKMPLVDREGALKIASELRRIGVNFNQVVKHLNSGEKVSEGQINAIGKELNEIWQLLNSALQGVQAD